MSEPREAPASCPFCGNAVARGHATCGAEACVSRAQRRTVASGCPVCGKPSGRGRYGYPTTDCGGDECRAELKRRRQRRLEAQLTPVNGGAIRDWKPGLPGEGGREFR